MDDNFTIFDAVRSPELARQVALRREASHKSSPSMVELHESNIGREIAHTPQMLAFAKLC